MTYRKTLIQNYEKKIFCKLNENMTCIKKYSFIRLDCNYCMCICVLCTCAFM